MYGNIPKETRPDIAARVACFAFREIIASKHCLFVGAFVRTSFIKEKISVESNE